MVARIGILKAPIDVHGRSNLDSPWGAQEEAAFGQWMKEQHYPEEEEYEQNPEAHKGGYNPPRDGHEMGVSPTGPSEKEFQQLKDKFNRQYYNAWQPEIGQSYAELFGEEEPEEPDEYTGGEDAAAMEAALAERHPVKETDEERRFVHNMLSRDPSQIATQAHGDKPEYVPGQEPYGPDAGGGSWSMDDIQRDIDEKMAPLEKAFGILKRLPVRGVGNYSGNEEHNLGMTSEEAERMIEADERRKENYLALSRPRDGSTTEQGGDIGDGNYGPHPEEEERRERYEESYPNEYTTDDVEHAMYSQMAPLEKAWSVFKDHEAVSEEEMNPTSPDVGPNTCKSCGKPYTGKFSYTNWGNEPWFNDPDMCPSCSQVVDRGGIPKLTPLETKRGKVHYTEHGERDRFEEDEKMAPLEKAFRLLKDLSTEDYKQAARTGGLRETPERRAAYEEEGMPYRPPPPMLPTGTQKNAEDMMRAQRSYWNTDMPDYIHDRVYGARHAGTDDYRPMIDPTDEWENWDQQPEHHGVGYFSDRDAESLTSGHSMEDPHTEPEPEIVSRNEVIPASGDDVQLSRNNFSDGLGGSQMAWTHPQHFGRQWFDSEQSEDAKAGGWSPVTAAETPEHTIQHRDERMPPHASDNYSSLGGHTEPDFSMLDQSPQSQALAMLHQRQQHELPDFARQRAKQEEIERQAFMERQMEQRMAETRAVPAPTMEWDNSMPDPPSDAHSAAMQKLAERQATNIARQRAKKDALDSRRRRKFSRR